MHHPFMTNDNCLSIANSIQVLLQDKRDVAMSSCKKSYIKFVEKYTESNSDHESHQ